MKAVIITMLVTGIFIFAGCAELEPRVAPRPKINWNDVQSIASAISVQRDDLKKTTSFKGPNSSKGILDTVLLRAWKSDEGGGFSYQIYVIDYYHGDWHFYDTASDSKGNNLNITLSSRDVSSCDYFTCAHHEHLGLNVSREYLEKNHENGIVFKVSGKGGEETFIIPSTYIKAFLSVAK
ncbi:hypothetical protein [Candidatus Nitrotoga sp. 1052]|uniref:hypothetical protein n=1 Tax=Candidatus Nitrotoga sp. 1052 TaxID=2886964 RepID=UPI001EF71D0A|nr:hypothetical protein [Candidatus Nitrotoga sp. 1052]CAH1075800.1 conserved hypothetical protein [Candidatus Nitrotoga sp. 1052]